jgi:hypothetical protein
VSLTSHHRTILHALRSSRRELHQPAGAPKSSRHDVTHATRHWPAAMPSSCVLGRVLSVAALGEVGTSPFNNPLLRGACAIVAVAGTPAWYRRVRTLLRSGVTHRLDEDPTPTAALRRERRRYSGRGRPGGLHDRERRPEPVRDRRVMAPRLKLNRGADARPPRPFWRASTGQVGHAIGPHAPHFRGNDPPSVDEGVTWSAVSVPVVIEGATT